MPTWERRWQLATNGYGSMEHHQSCRMAPSCRGFPSIWWSSTMREQDTTNNREKKTSQLAPRRSASVHWCRSCGELAYAVHGCPRGAFCSRTPLLVRLFDGKRDLHSNKPEPKKNTANHEPLASSHLAHAPAVETKRLAPLLARENSRKTGKQKLVPIQWKVATFRPQTVMAANYGNSRLSTER